MHMLEVWVKNPLGFVVGVADTIADHAPLAADVTNSGHLSTLKLIKTRWHANMRPCRLASFFNCFENALD